MLIRKWILCVIFFAQNYCTFCLRWRRNVETYAEGLCVFTMGLLGKETDERLFHGCILFQNEVFFVAFAGRSTLSKYNIFNQYQEITRA